MPRRRLHRGGEQSAKHAVFLNIPYDPQFTELFLAYMVGIKAYGLIPRATLEIPGGARRLDRIAALIRSCTYSIHDLSRVELDPAPPQTPRFNMPFELGLAVAFHWRQNTKHTWFVLETERWRIQKSLSDLNGTDVYIHGGTPEGVFRELTTAFVRVTRQPTVKQMQTLYEKVTSALPKLLVAAGTDDPFQARVFKDISVYAGALADELAV
ncbi:MAG TPA: hypothetical protein VG759_15705 [Candidatus Angelobacter sp.]|jgi:hypothetical protein|nr:hypothetical protein [Candidatus Angelobacter sp.]